jgi:transcriptional regulator with XRE-family HTH domain
MASTTRRVNGAAVRALREAIGISLTDLAFAVGISKPQLHRIETGGSQTSPEVYRKIADRLGVPLDAITHPGDKVPA